jgi:hypothetical protein
MKELRGDARFWALAIPIYLILFAVAGIMAKILDKLFRS